VYISPSSAFGLAAPTAVMVTTGLAAKYGVLIRRGAAIQYASAVTAIAFDKTGTLTEGKTSVSNFDLVEDDNLEGSSSCCDVNSSYSITTLLKAGVRQNVDIVPVQLLRTTLSLLMKAEVCTV